LYHELTRKVNKGSPYAEYDCTRNPLTRTHCHLHMFSLTIGKREIAGAHYKITLKKRHWRLSQIDARKPLKTSVMIKARTTVNKEVTANHKDERMAKIRRTDYGKQSRMFKGEYCNCQQGFKLQYRHTNSLYLVSYIFFCTNRKNFFEYLEKSVQFMVYDHFLNSYKSPFRLVIAD